MAPPARADGPEGECARAQRRREVRSSDLHEVLWAALADLPRQQRATLVLRCNEDLANGEIARVLGVSAGTVKSNASRGLATLRQRVAAAADLAE